MATFLEYGLCFLPQQVTDLRGGQTVTSVSPVLHWTQGLSPLSDSEVTVGLASQSPTVEG